MPPEGVIASLQSSHNDIALEPDNLLCQVGSRDICY